MAKYYFRARVYYLKLRQWEGPQAGGPPDLSNTHGKMDDGQSVRNDIDALSLLGMLLPVPLEVFPFM